MAKFYKSGVPEFKVPEEIALIFGYNRIFFYHSVGRAEGSHAKKQLDSFSRFDKTPTCDGQTDRHRPMASAADA